MTSMLSIYDMGLKALVFDKAKSVMGLTDLIKDSAFDHPDVVLRHIAEKRGSNSVGFVSLWRNTTQGSLVRRNYPAATRRGTLAIDRPRGQDYLSASASPLDLSYSITFWSKSLDIINSVVEEFSFWWAETPALDIEIQAGDSVPIRAPIILGAFNDKSNTSRRYEQGQIYSVELSVQLMAWSIKLREIPTIRRVIVKLYDASGPGGPDQWREHELLTIEKELSIEEPVNVDPQPV